MGANGFHDRRGLWLFLSTRILLGLSGGVTIPLSQTLLLNEYPDRLKSLGLSIWGMFTILPFTVGLPVGGWIVDQPHWRYLFYLDTVVSSVLESEL